MSNSTQQTDYKTLVILISHAATASAFMSAVSNMNIPLSNHFILSYDIANTNDPDKYYEQILDDIKPYLKTQITPSCLLVTDLVGSTPYNISKKLNGHLNTLSKTNIDSAMVTGINLPMLLKIINYQNLPATELANKAFETGRECITCETTTEIESHD